MQVLNYSTKLAAPRTLLNQVHSLSKERVLHSQPKRQKLPLLTKLICQFTKEKIIPNFRKQARIKQFAVVNLWSTSDCMNKLASVKLYPSPNVKVSRPSMPSRYDYGNYIVACPTSRGKKHAEQIIFDEFESLYRAFHLTAGENPACIFLYSWLMPCVKCTDLIINKLELPPYNNIPVIIAYTNPNNTDGEAIENESRKRLLNKNFTVYKV